MHSSPTPSALARRTVTWSAVTVLGVLSVAVLRPPSASAEGSRDLYPTDRVCTTSGACRTSLEWRTGSYGPAGSSILRRTVLSVYARAGEVLETGSSAVGVGQGDVLVYDPGVITNDQTPALPTLVPGTNGYTCSGQRTSSGVAAQGRITSRALELAGPRAVAGGGNPAGYVPCAYTAPDTGIYKVIFYGPAGGNSNAEGGPTGDITMSSANNFGAAQGTSVSAWDVTVRASATSVTDLPGRVFTYALAAFTGSNGRPVDQVVYATTLDGYQYRIDTNGLDPNGFVLYGNEKGFLAPDGETPLYHDVLGNNGNLSVLQGGASLAPPEYPLSFERLAPETLAALGIGDPVAPRITALSFAGSISDNNSRIGAGGTFRVTQTVHATYSLVISRDGTNFDPGNPRNRVLTGVADAGTTTVAWDGDDNAGDPFPVGDDYAVEGRLQAGVNHFPLIDAENSVRGGPSFTLLNPPDGECPFGNPACTTAFYDDRGYHTDAGGGTDVGTPGQVLCGNLAPNPAYSNPATGYVSTSTQRKWGASSGGNTNTSCTGNFGDAKGLDTWAFYPSTTRRTSLNILPLPPAPKANDDANVTPVNVPVTVPANAGLLANDTGDGISVTAHTEPANGTVTVNPDGSYTYTPDTDFVGTDTFTYTITDSAGRTSTATVTITVKPPPVARDDVGTTPANTPLSGASVLGNDVGPGIQVTDHTTPAHGQVEIQPDGTYVYTPDPDYSGPDSFTYTITSDTGDTSTATVRLTVTPTATDDTGNTRVNTPLHGDSVLGNDHGSDLTVASHGQPSHGSVAVNDDGTYVYTPDPDYSGPDSFTYTAIDGSGHTVTATVNLTVTPTAVNDTGITPIDTPLSVPAASGLLANDHGTGLSVDTYTPPGHGTVVVNDDGSYTYTPDAGYSGIDRFTYTVIDADGNTDTATVTITVGLAASPDSATTPVNTPVTLDPLANDRGDGLRITAVTQPPASEGHVEIVDGKIVFTPADGFSGIAHYTYTITDGNGQTDTATDTVTVTPKARPDETTTPADTPVTLDSVADDLGRGLAITAVTQPPSSEGHVEIVDGKIVFTPAHGFTGVAHFDYTVTDAAGQTATARDTVTVLADVAATPDEATTSQGEPVVIDPLANDSGDLDPGTLQLENPGTGTWGGSVHVPDEGTFTVDTSTGTVTFTPDQAFTGTTPPVRYRVLGADGRRHVSTITVVVDGGIAFTGSPTGQLLLYGLGLLAVGGAATALGRRRRS